MVHVYVSNSISYIATSLIAQSSSLSSMHMEWSILTTNYILGTYETIPELSDFMFLCAGDVLCPALQGLDTRLYLHCVHQKSNC